MFMTGSQEVVGSNPIFSNADAVNSLCTVNTVHGLRDCQNNDKPIQCPILLTFS